MSPAISTVSSGVIAGELAAPVRPPFVVERGAERAVSQDAAIGRPPACGMQRRDGIGIGDGRRPDRHVASLRRPTASSDRRASPSATVIHESFERTKVWSLGAAWSGSSSEQVVMSRSPERTRRLIGQGRAAVGAEGACGVLRRLEALRLAGHEPDRVRRHAEPRHRRGAGGMPAHRAMADRLVGGLGVDLVAHGAAETASSQHHRLLIASSSSLGLAQHGRDHGRAAGLGAAQDLEAMPLVQRDVPRDWTIRDRRARRRDRSGR